MIFWKVVTQFFGVTVRSSQNCTTFWTWVIIMHNKLCIISVSLNLFLLVGHLCSVFSTETLVFMFQITKPGRTRSTGDSRAAELITTRLQIEASLGSLAKDNIKTWRLCRNGSMNDTPSWLRSTSKVKRHSSSPKLVRCSADCPHQQTVSRKKAPMAATTVAQATHTKNRGNFFIRRWHLHLEFGKPWSEQGRRMIRYPQMRRSQAITASSWQWWRNLQATFTGCGVFVNI